MGSTDILAVAISAVALLIVGLAVYQVWIEQYFVRSPFVSQFRHEGQDRQTLVCEIEWLKELTVRFLTCNNERS